MQPSTSRNSISRREEPPSFDGDLGASFSSMVDMPSSGHHFGLGRPRRRIPQTLISSGASTASPNPRPQLEDDGENSSVQSNGSSLRHAASYKYSLQRSSSNANDLPSLRAVFADLLLVSSLHCRRAVSTARERLNRLQRGFLFVVFAATVIFLALAVWMFLDFCIEAARVCRPPLNYEYSMRRPLVEYYVHGHGIGHYARSVGVVDRLNKAGIDVRMFLTRAALWRAMHEDSIQYSTKDATTDTMDNLGRTTAISIAAMLPSFGFVQNIMQTAERVLGDCDVSVASKRFPDLVIVDGDVPGALRAKIGGIPFVSMAHGLLYRIAQKPDWIRETPRLDRAWDEQSTINSRYSFFSQWQIATHVCFFESSTKSGVVAKPPLRPQVLRMAMARQQVREGHAHPTIPRQERIADLLYLDKTPNTGSQSTKAKRRKLVICYFRDRNGDMVVQALIAAGFDVLLFDTSYNRAMAYDPSRFGAKWIVQNPENKEFRVRLLNEKSGGVTSRRIENENITRPELITSQNQSRNELAYGQDRDSQSSSNPKLIRVTDRSLFVPLMHIADGVASSAGSQLMSECIFSQMPLFAVYRGNDSEQELNLEMSKHEGPCRKPLVFGTSFEELERELKDSSLKKMSESQDFSHFVAQVRASSVSQAFYKNYDRAHSASSTQFNVSELVLTNEEDPFQSLPDAADIILEIVKKVTS